MRDLVYSEGVDSSEQEIGDTQEFTGHALATVTLPPTLTVIEWVECQ
jgi:hypothetical protein